MKIEEKELSKAMSNHFRATFKELDKEFNKVKRKEIKKLFFYDKDCHKERLVKYSIRQILNKLNIHFPVIKQSSSFRYLKRSLINKVATFLSQLGEEFLNRSVPKPWVAVPTEGVGVCYGFSLDEIDQKNSIARKKILVKRAEKQRILSIKSKDYSEKMGLLVNTPVAPPKLEIV